MSRRTVRRVSRYILRKHLRPFGLALTGLTTLLIINQIAKRLGGLLERELPISVIFKVFALSVPFIVAFTLPIAVLVAVLRVFTRLPADREITAIDLGGVTVMRLVAPALWVAACVAALTFVWNDL